MSAKKKDPKLPTGDLVTDIILESISDGVFTVDHNWRIMTFNRAAEEITGTSREEAIGRYCWEVFRANMCEGDCALKRTMKEGKPFVSSSTYIISNEQRKVPIAVSTSPLKNDKGDILGGVETFRDHTLVEELRRELHGGHELAKMFSRSEQMQKLFAILPQVATSDSTVLIDGETGTGKELLANALHELSDRRDEKFVAINCGALPDSLLESELFGYRAGAFTGAAKDKPGLFQAADNGTIFLDEIGETSSAFQVRLLRVLQEKQFQPLGSVKKRTTNARIIAATNRELDAMVERNEFRKDLYYRINIINLHLPPLRQRLEDVPLLVERFIDKLNKIKGKAITGISNEALTRLMNHNFPGNIRELENIVEHAFILCDNSTIALHHFPPYLRRQEENPAAQEPFLAVSKMATEKELLLAALKKNNYNRLAAARELGIHKTTLFRKIHKYRIKLPATDGRTRSSQ